MKTVVIFAMLSLILLFSSQSTTQTSIILLAQLTIEDFKNNRAEALIGDCTASDMPIINAVMIESDDEKLALRELQIDDGFSSTESVFIKNNTSKEKNSWKQLANATCVSKISLLGHGIGARQTKRSLVKIWAYRQ